jgi:hypothetical protein
MKPFWRFKARITGFTASFYPAEKGFESFVQTAEGLIQRLFITGGKIFIFLAEFSQKIDLVKTGYSPLLSFPSILPHSEGAIVQPAMNIELTVKRLGLVSGGIETVFESPNHN